MRSQSLVAVVISLVSFPSFLFAQSEPEEWGCQADEQIYDEANLKNHSGFDIDASLDLDGDGIDDIAFAGGVREDERSAYVQLSNLAGGQPRLIEFSGLPARPFTGGASPSIAMLRDFNGGGMPDIAIGVPTAGSLTFVSDDEGCPGCDCDYDGNQGRVWIFFGETEDSWLDPLGDTVFECEKDPADALDTDADVVIVNDSESRDLFGAALAGGDFARFHHAVPYGHSDLAIGAPGEPENAGTTGCDPVAASPGAFYVLKGQAFSGDGPFLITTSGDPFPHGRPRGARRI